MHSVPFTALEHRRECCCPSCNFSNCATIIANSSPSRALTGVLNGKPLALTTAVFDILCVSQTSEPRVAALRESGGRDRSGFWDFKIGGEPERTGHYEWDADRSVYVNEHGHTRPDKPDCEFGGGATDEEQAAIQEALSDISDEEAGQ